MNQIKSDLEKFLKNITIEDWISMGATLATKGIGRKSKVGFVMLIMAKYLFTKEYIDRNK